MFWQELPVKPDTSQQDLQRIGNHMAVVNLSRADVFVASASRILAEGMAYRASVEASRSLWSDGGPIPAMSYGIIEYLMGLDLRGMDVLEVGGGESTAFWAARTKSVLTLETNPPWAETIRRNVPAATVESVAPDDLPQRIAALDRSFDIIVIDCAANRARCARASLGKVRSGGFVILDNSDWYPNASRILRESGLIQVDFHDFRPLHHFRCTTTLFMTPDFRPKPAQNRLPTLPIGGKRLENEPWDIE